VIASIRDIETIAVSHGKLAVARKHPAGAAVLAAAHQCQAHRKAQLPGFIALLSDAIHTPAIADPQLLYPVVAAVGDEEVRAVCREALWPIKVARSCVTAADAPKCIVVSIALRVQVAGAEEPYAVIGSVGRGKPTAIRKTNPHTARIRYGRRLLADAQSRPSPSALASRGPERTRPCTRA